MKLIKRLSMGALILLVLIMSFCSWLYYVSKADPGYASYIKGVDTNEVSIYDLVSGRYDEHLTLMSDYAQLCDVVYRRPGEVLIDTLNQWRRSSLGMENFIDTTDKTNKPNLYFEIWEYDKNTEETIVAIVFRGTQFSSFSDWKANFRWFVMGLDENSQDHYDVLGKISETIVDTIIKEYSGKKVQIVSTGHSLGGGLAQFMAYSTSKVKLVYAFDSSPVTGYYDVKPRSKRKSNKQGVTIYRIYESGEILSTARYFMTALYPAPLFKTKNPALIRIRFSFRTGVGPAKQHSISDFAKSLKMAKSESLRLSN